MRHILSILAENESGALSRISGLFSARGYNIDSLTVAPTEDPTMSRFTVVTSGSDRLNFRARATPAGKKVETVETEEAA